MGWNGTNLLTNGEHDMLWRNAAKDIPEIKEQLEIMNKLKYIELLKDAGMPEENIRQALTNLGKKIGYTVSFDDVK